MKSKILAIDDEQKNLKLIKGFLAGLECELITAKDGLEGWDVLLGSYQEIDVILLDRMMPRMDGMALNARIKSHPEMAKIPVIMQTAAAQPAQVVEGIQAGVYYYLTKPYNAGMLISLVNAAISKAKELKTLSVEVGRYKKMVGLIDQSDFSFASLEEARDLTLYLANFFPDPQKIMIGIREMLMNAVEHGNLGIGYEKKGDFNLEGRWEEEVTRRLALPQYADKRVRVHYEKTSAEIVLTIRDEGEGFDWQNYLAFDPQRATDNHGRGIAIAVTLSFDEVEYRGSGNEVSCKVRLLK